MVLGTVDTLDDLTRWLRGDLLEIVLLISGAFLFVRGARWLLTASPRDAESNAASIDGLGGPGRRDPAVAQALGWVVTAFVSVVIGVLVADRFGLPLATLVPTATIAGIALGFGAQRIVLDLLSGFFLLTERQMSVGDVVTVSKPGTTDGVTGTVEEITLRATRLRTLLEGEVVYISNGEIRQLTNQSVEWARLVIDVPLRPDGDVEHAIEVLRDACEQIRADEEMADTLLEGPDVLGVQALDVGVIRVRLAARVPAGAQWSVAREIRRRVVQALVDAGVEPAPPVVITRGEQ